MYQNKNEVNNSYASMLACKAVILACDIEVGNRIIRRYKSNLKYSEIPLNVIVNEILGDIKVSVNEDTVKNWGKYNKVFTIVPFTNIIIKRDKQFVKNIKFWMKIRHITIEGGELTMTINTDGKSEIDSTDFKIALDIQLVKQILETITSLAPAMTQFGVKSIEIEAQEN